MSETGLAAVLLMIGMVMLVMCYWKQIAIFLLFVAGYRVLRRESTTSLTSLAYTYLIDNSILAILN